MVAFNKFFSSVLLAILYASYGNATPTVNHGTHYVRRLGKGQLEFFYPPTNYTTFGAGVEIASSFGNSGIENKTVSYVSSELKVDSTKVSFRSGYNQDGLSYGYVKQAHDSIPFVNAVANVAFKDNKVVAFGHSFVPTNNIASPTPSVDVNTVIPNVERVLEGKVNDIKPTVEYLARSDGTVALVHVFQVRNGEAGTWYEAYVDAHSGELISLTDFVSDASYKVSPVYKGDLTEGFELLTDPQNIASSPSGWHNDGTTNTTDTSGNNVLVFVNFLGGTTTESADGLVFDYNYDTTKEPGDGNNIDASRVNVFYLVNSYHDTLYQYGFTEAAFNFQNNNFDKGGAGNDRIFISVQDRFTENGSNFATPPDGSSGSCSLGVFTSVSPSRDAAIENDVPIHEFTHGLTNRMTGGGTGRCLKTPESGGMGEGWSDVAADWFSHSNSSQIHDFVIGSYVTNNVNGFRSRPYSTSSTTNPLRYSDIGQLDEVHAIGEVWANVLHNVYAALVDKHGWSSTARTSANGNEGNIVFLQLLVDGLALQPCNPDIPAAREAIIQADVNRYGGANKCLLWKTFASRGLGVGAANHVDSFEVPDDC